MLCFFFAYQRTKYAVGVLTFCSVIDWYWKATGTRTQRVRSTTETECLQLQKYTPCLSESPMLLYLILFDLIRSRTAMEATQVGARFGDTNCAAQSCIIYLKKKPTSIYFFAVSHARPLDGAKLWRSSNEKWSTRHMRHRARCRVRRWIYTAMPSIASHRKIFFFICCLNERSEFRRYSCSVYWRQASLAWRVVRSSA